MLRLLGIALLLHGLAHAGAGMWAHGPEWFTTPLWLIATVGFMAAGFGALGVRGVQLVVAHLTIVAAVASVCLLYFFPSPLVIPGVMLDLTFTIVLTRVGIQQRLEASALQARNGSRGRNLALAFSVAFLAYATGVMLARPWAMRMGTTRADREVALFGDSLHAGARYCVDNAITIHAPIDSVWPWLAQIGQDRGGFYSYEWLEDLFGARITNATRIIPEWTHPEAGGFVRAVPDGYLGGVFGDSLGWRIVAVDSGHALVLENWGAFTVRPIDSVTTRLQIRQRNPGVPSLLGTVMSPVGLLVLEPAHFIMQRGMLRGIRARSERMMQPQVAPHSGR